MWGAGTAEGGVFLGETPKNLPKNSLSSLPFVYRAPPVFSTLRRAWGVSTPLFFY